jgi:hypothetical protein
MMSILERAESVLSQVRAVAEKEATLERVQRLLGVEQDAQALRRQASESFELVSALRSAGGEVPVEAGALRQRVDQVRATVATEDFELRRFNELRTEVVNELSAASAGAKTAWREVVEQQVPNRDGLGKLAQTFADLRPDDPRNGQLGGAIREARRLAGEAPSVEALGRLRELGEQIRALIAELVGEGEEVRRFVDRAASGGASIDDVTDEVRSWIAENEFGQSFRIVAGPPEA